nr:hypothetical protein [Flavobacterium sp.]
MENVDYLKYQILYFVNNIERTYNVNQLEESILSQILDRENYDDYFDSAFRFLKNNSFISVGKNNTGTDTVSSLTEKGETVLKFGSWEKYLQNIVLEKQKEKEIKDIDLKLKEATLKNQRFLPYTSISGLVFGLGSMVWSIMDKYHLIFVNISIYFLILILFTIGGILVYKKS